VGDGSAAGLCCAALPLAPLKTGSPVLRRCKFVTIYFRLHHRHARPAHTHRTGPGPPGRVYFLTPEHLLARATTPRLKPTLRGDVAATNTLLRYLFGTAPARRRCCGARSSATSPRGRGGGVDPKRVAHYGVQLWLDVSDAANAADDSGRGGGGAVSRDLRPGRRPARVRDLGRADAARGGRGPRRRRGGGDDALGLARAAQKVRGRRPPVLRAAGLDALRRAQQPRAHIFHLTRAGAAANAKAAAVAGNAAGAKRQASPAGRSLDPPQLLPSRRGCGRRAARGCNETSGHGPCRSRRYSRAPEPRPGGAYVAHHQPPPLAIARISLSWCWGALADNFDRRACAREVDAFPDKLNRSELIFKPRARLVD
jgi:hypothetical protein